MLLITVRSSELIWEMWAERLVRLAEPAKSRDLFSKRCSPRHRGSEKRRKRDATKRDHAPKGGVQLWDPGSCSRSAPPDETPGGIVRSRPVSVAVRAPSATWGQRSGGRPPDTFHDSVRGRTPAGWIRLEWELYRQYSVPRLKKSPARPLGRQRAGEGKSCAPRHILLYSWRTLR